MSDAQVFDLAITYDDQTLRAAAKVLFRHNVKAKLRMLTGGAVALLFTAGMCIYLRLYSFLWWIGLYLLAYPALFAYVRWAIGSRLRKLIGTSMEMQMTQSGFSIKSGGELHTFPWTRISSFTKDRDNIYIFLGRSAAYILPIRQAGELAVEFAMDRMGGISDLT